MVRFLVAVTGPEDATITVTEERLSIAVEGVVVVEGKWFQPVNHATATWEVGECKINQGQT